MATLDLDARQGTLGRYVENRAAYATRKGVDLPMPIHAAVPLSELADRTEAQADERARLEAALVAAFGWTWPRSAANFLLVDVGPRAADIYRALKARQILVRWWGAPELASSLRITVGRPEENDALVAALRDVV